MRIVLIFISILYTSQGADIASFAGVDTTLKLVHVVFRHGDRTPDSLYANDPYTEEDFYPFRIGHLTNKGKMTSYNIGTYLRKKYGKLLGDVYTPDIVSGIASHYPRAKATLQAVLAGLYPPTDVLTWNKDLLWEPIPYDYLPERENKLFLPIFSCPNVDILMDEAYAMMDTDPIVQKYNYLLPFLIEKSGSVDSNLFKIAGNLFSTLKSEDELGLELPNLTQVVYPDTLREITEHGWKYYTVIGDLKTIIPGFLVSQIINNTYSTINGEETAKNKKIYLYSGHDLNVAALLIYLDNFVLHNPRYGSHIIIEVHKYLGIYFLKFLHQNYDYIEPRPLFIPNCGIYCPLEVFVKLHAKELDPVRLEALCGLN